MVATLVKLRFAMLANQLRKSPWQIVAVVVGALYGLSLIVFAVGGLIFLSFSDVELSSTIITLGGAALILGWTVLPALTAGIDQTVDPARLATFPIPRNTLVLALAVSGLLGIPGIVTLLVSLSTAATWWKYPIAAVVAIVCAVIGATTAVVGSRMLVAIASRVGSGRRSRELKGLFIFIPLLLLGPIIFGLTSVLRDSLTQLPAVANVVGWTPFGAIWAVPGDVASGNWGAAVARFLIGIATLAAFVLIWRWALERALEQPANDVAAPVKARGLGLFGLFPGTPTGAVAARAATYWIRDPRYAQSLISVPLIPILIIFYGSINDNFAVLAWIGPIVAILLAMSIYTDVSYDNTAFALHLQTGVSGVADRTGRVIALAIFAIPVSILLLVGGLWFTNEWHMLPGMLGITIGVLLTGFGLSSIVSGWFAFVVPAPGESPFKSKPGGGVSLMVSMFVLWTLLIVLAAPELVLAIIGFVTGEALYGWIALALGVVLGTVFMIVGIKIGARILDRNGPEMLVQLQRQK